MKKLYIIGLLFGVLSSCDDFLDKEPSTALPVESAITTMTDLRNAVNGIGYIVSEGRMTYSSDFAIYADLKGSDFKAVSNNNHAGPLYRYNITKKDDLPYYAYYYFYKAIANVNKVLTVIDNIQYSEDETAEFNDYKGQLYAWRALLHFDLARIFCNAPTCAPDINAASSGIVLSTEVYEAGYTAPRSTLEQTYARIIGDFSTALPLLKNGLNNGYINYWAALALRARAYLYYGDNKNAKTDADEVISCKLYSLYDISEYEAVWKQEFTKESLFELRITTNYNAQRNSVGYYCDSEGYGECAFVEDGELLIYLQNHPEDIRSKLIKDQRLGTEKGLYPAKYPGRENNLYVNNPKIIRLSDVYLIAAEAALKDNKDATPYINTLREKRIEGYKNIASVTLDDILFERRIELFAENSMAFDYWRNKKSIKNATQGEINYDDYRTIFPIPQDEIDMAPSILKQNPKY